MTVVTERPPKENAFRSMPEVMSIRAEADDERSNVLSGHFAVFNTWTEINSAWEGRFLESIAPGAFSKTFREQRDQIKVLLQHGYDPELGDRPIARITDLREDGDGAYYEAELLDGVPDVVVSGLRAGLYGASFRFRVVREEWNEDPEPSDHNPLGLPERTIKECSVREFGPVTWGAYPEATAQMEAAGEGMRSLTDEWILDRLTAQPEKLRALIEKRSERMSAETRALNDLEATIDGEPAADGEPVVDAERSDDEPSVEDSTAAPDAPVDESPVAPAEDDTRREGEPDAPEEVADNATDDTHRTHTPKKSLLRGPSWFIG